MFCLFLALKSWRQTTKKKGKVKRGIEGAEKKAWATLDKKAVHHSILPSCAPVAQDSVRFAKLAS